MDPKNNANPAASDDEQTTPPQTDIQDTMPSLGDDSAQSSTNSTDEASVPAGTPPPVEDAGTPVGNVPASPDASGNPPEVAFGTDSRPDAAVEEPASVGSSSSPASGTVTPEAASTPAPEAPASVTINTSAPSALPADQQSASSEPVPPIAPVPAANSDKKTILVLSVVAVVLLIAIAVLYLVV